MQSRREPARGRLALAAAAGCAAALFSLVAAAATDVRSGDRFSFALTGGRLLAAPGRAWTREDATIRSPAYVTVTWPDLSRS